MKKMRIMLPIVTFISTLILLNCVFYIGYVPTASMAPTIEPQDRIWGIRIFRNLNVGDVIAFKYKDTFLVKRIAACPGDIINLSDKEIIVPKNCYYVLGDNPASSFDSRYWENPFVNRHDIKAKIFIRKQNTVK